ncbi:hypothetical protein FAM18126_02168 [Lacticaseibacillus paracasei]|nr:hypothetical protein FAM18126_02168 [Lacticaseibacillus paracasei]
MPFAEVIMNPSAGNARWKKQLPELVAIIESHFAPRILVRRAKPAMPDW